jgi:hypothetical protein
LNDARSGERDGLGAVGRAISDGECGRLGEQG